MLSDDVRGTVENSESECSDCRKLLRKGKEPELWLVDKFVLEKPGGVSVAFALWSCTGEPALALFGLLNASSLLLPGSSMDSLFSLSSFSLRRKSTHKSAKDWKRSKQLRQKLNFSLFGDQICKETRMHERKSHLYLIVRCHVCSPFSWTSS